MNVDQHPVSAIPAPHPTNTANSTPLSSLHVPSTSAGMHPPATLPEPNVSTADLRSKMFGGKEKGGQQARRGNIYTKKNPAHNNTNNTTNQQSHTHKQHQHTQQQQNKRQKPSTSTSSDGDGSPSTKDLLHTILSEMRGKQAEVEKDMTEMKSVMQSNEHRSMENSDAIERMKRTNDLVVRGVPLVGRHNEYALREIIGKIADTIKCQLATRDMVFVHQVVSRHGERHENIIVIRFSTAAVRRDFLSQYLQMNGGLTTQCLGYAAAERIFISDNLTFRNAAIRKKAAALKSQGQICSHTIRDGLVCVVVRPDDRRIAVHSLAELSNLVNENEWQIHIQQEMKYSH